MVRSHEGIRGAFIVETASEGKSGLAVQLEGSRFETVWQLKEGGVDGILDLNKVRRVSLSPSFPLSLQPIFFVLKNIYILT